MFAGGFIWPGAMFLRVISGYESGSEELTGGEIRFPDQTGNPVHSGSPESLSGRIKIILRSPGSPDPEGDLTGEELRHTPGILSRQYTPINDSTGQTRESAIRTRTESVFTGTNRMIFLYPTVVPDATSRHVPSDNRIST